MEYSIPAKSCMSFPGDNRIWYPNLFFTDGSYICRKKYLKDDFGDCLYCNVYGCDYCETFSTCKICTVGYFMLNKGCYKPCPIGYYENSTSMTCIRCDDTCYSCSANSTDCIQCARDYLRMPFVSTCVKACPKGYYKKDNTTCGACNSNCASCYGPSYMNCVTCADNAWYFSQGVCILQCPDGYYSNYGDRTCKPCHSSCATCFTRGTFGCLSCMSTLLYLYKGNCILCDNSCNTCKGTLPTDCLSCKIKTTLKDGSCIPITCNKGYYAGDYACLKCPDSCTECESPNYCLECSNGNRLVKSSCRPCAVVPGYEPIVGSCVEVCGDGLNMGLVECDDGNSYDGDGCSHDCKIEAGYSCSGGTFTDPDVCELSSKTSAETAIEGSAITLKFSTPVKVIGDLKESLLIVTLPDLTIISDYVVIKISDTQYMLDFANSKEIKSQQTLEIRVKKPKNLLDSSNNPIYFKPVDFSIVKTQIVEDVKLASAASSAVIGFTFGVILATGGANLMWSLLNSLQSLTYMKFINLEFPELLGVILNFSKFAQLDWIPNFIQILFAKIDPESFSQDATPSFKKYEYSATFLLNSGSTLSLMLLLLVGKTASRFLNRAFRLPFHDILVESTTIYKIFQVYFNFYFVMMIGALLQVQSSSFENYFLGLSSLIAYGSIIFLLLSPIIILKYSAKQAKRKRTMVVRASDFIPDEYSLKGFFSRNFMIFEMIDKSIYAIGLVLLYETPYIQMSIILMGKIMITVLMIKVKPFKTKNKYYQRLLTEFLMICALLSFIFMKISNYRKGLIMSSTVFVASILMVNVVMIAQHSLMVLRKFLLRKRMKTKKGRKKRSERLNLKGFGFSEKKLKRGDVYNKNGRKLVVVNK